MTMQTLIFALAVALAFLTPFLAMLAFGGVWWFCTRQALNAAMLVFLSHSLLGVAV